MPTKRINWNQSAPTLNKVPSSNIQRKSTRKFVNFSSTKDDAELETVPNLSTAEVPRDAFRVAKTHMSSSPIHSEVGQLYIVNKPLSVFNYADTNIVKYFDEEKNEISYPVVTLHSAHVKKLPPHSFVLTLQPNSVLLLLDKVRAYAKTNSGKMIAIRLIKIAINGEMYYAIETHIKALKNNEVIVEI